MLTTLHSELTKKLSPLEPIHFIGIGGSGMAPLARLVADAGVKVSGSDRALATASNPALSEIPVNNDHADFYLLAKAKTVVHSSAIKEDNPELAEARSRGIRILHRSELLAIVASWFKLITVAGTHGKSTTSALVVHVLAELGLNPSFVLGAELQEQDQTRGRASKLDSGEWLVIEADESDGSFLNYQPDIAIVTNIDPDHMEYFGSMAKMEQIFATHLSKIKPDGSAVLFWDHPRVRALGESLELHKRCAYGSFIGCDVRLLDVTQSGTSTHFRVVVDKSTQTVTLPLIGKHNAINALAALAVTELLGKPLDRAVAALAKFPGVARRLSLHYDDSYCLVYDDYAHNPVKIASCLDGLRQGFPDSAIVAIFQPHRYSRMQHLYADFTTAFASADEVIVLPVYAAGETPLPWVTTERIAHDIAAGSKVDTEHCGSLKDALELIQLKKPQTHTVFVTIGAGDVWKVARDYAVWLRASDRHSP